MLGFSTEVRSISEKKSSYFSIQCPLAELPCLCDAGLRDPSSFDALHSFRASNGGTHSEQSVTVEIVVTVGTRTVRTGCIYLYLQSCQCWMIGADAAEDVGQSFGSSDNPASTPSSHERWGCFQRVGGRSLLRISQPFLRPEPREVLHHIVRKARRHRQLYCT